MELLPGFVKRLQVAQELSTNGAQKTCRLPLAPEFFRTRTTLVNSQSALVDMVNFLLQRPLAFIGIDTEYRYRRPGVPIKKGIVAHDCRSAEPLLLSLAAAEPSTNGFSLSVFIVDLTGDLDLAMLALVLRLPVPFVGHNLKVELFCLYALSLPGPVQLWDTYILERAITLGRRFGSQKSPEATAPQHQQIAAEEMASTARTSGLGLLATARRYGVHHRFANTKHDLQTSFINHQLGTTFSKEQIEYAAEDAIVAASIYPPQITAAIKVGLLHHMTTIEMPWVATNARIQWNGVRVDANKINAVKGASKVYLEELSAKLNAHGIQNARSHPQLIRFFKSIGLLEAFRKKNKYSFDKAQLAPLVGQHPAIELIQEYRRVSDLSSNKILAAEFIGEDGRLHPDHRQLGADSGRQSCRHPNIAGIGSVHRPIVVPDIGYGIGEVDWSQIEIGITAAVYRDQTLVQMFNSGDVYAAMAQRFYQARLPAAAGELPTREFKRQYPNERSRMKTCTLAIIYGITPHGLARYLDCTIPEAAGVYDQFMAMFPVLSQALSDAAHYATIRGFATTCTGLRRYRSHPGHVSHHEKNWFTNHPIQGSAGDVFKAAGNRLHRLYPQHDARIIIPLHDAFIFTAPLAALVEVAALTETVMIQTVQEYFPELLPRAEVNISHPECWNKDGDAESLDRWLGKVE